MPNSSGYPAFVWLLRRSCPSEGNTSAAAHRTAASLWLRSTYDDAQVSQPHTYMHILPCLSRWQVPCTSKTSSFHSSAAGTWSFGTLVHNNINVVQLKPTKNLQRLLVPLAFATAKSALFLVGSPAHPKMLAAVANRWADTESKAPSSSGMVKANDDGLAFDSRMLKLKMKSRRGRAGRRGRARVHVSTVDCARSPYGESTFKRNRPSFAVLMVLGGGGALSAVGVWVYSCLPHKTITRLMSLLSCVVRPPVCENNYCNDCVQSPLDIFNKLYNVWSFLYKQCTSSLPLFQRSTNEQTIVCWNSFGQQCPSSVKWYIPFDWRRALLPETVSTYDRLLVSVTLEKREGACALFVQKTPDMFTNLPSARKTLNCIMVYHCTCSWSITESFTIDSFVTNSMYPEKHRGRRRAYKTENAATRDASINNMEELSKYR